MSDLYVCPECAIKTNMPLTQPITQIGLVNSGTLSPRYEWGYVVKCQDCKKRWLHRNWEIIPAPSESTGWKYIGEES